MSVCVVTAMDEGYLIQTEVMLVSLDSTYSGKEKLEIRVLISPSLLDYEFKYDFNVINVKLVPVTQVEDPEVETAMVETYKFLRLTSASMYRYFMADQLPEFDKAVYLDADIILNKDITPLLEYELSTPIAALHEVQLVFNDNPQYRDTAYFNSGVMVVDLKFWRDKDISTKLLKQTETMSHWTGSGDQDVLNVLFKGKWTPLPLSFNYMVNVYKTVDIKEPLVIHWAGKTKPWLSNSPEDKWKQLWKQYRAKLRTTT